MGITNLLGYYKFEIIESIKQFIRKNRFRLCGTSIKAGSTFHKSAILHRKIRIGYGTCIGENTKLASNVTIGSYASIINIEVGENSSIESRVICTGFGNGTIVIGKESYIGISNVLDFSDNISIGDFVHIAGPSTGLWTHSSAQMCLQGIPLKDKSPTNRPTAPIIIENNVYIGGNCTIYPGITIGHHSIVAPNSAVAKDVEPYTLVGGVPAKFIKKIEIDERSGNHQATSH